MGRPPRVKPKYNFYPGRAAEVGKKILATYSNGGIFGFKVTPQHVPPQTADTLEKRLRFVTQTVALDYLRDSYRLYNAGRETFDDPETSWLYDPTVVAEASFKTVADALKKHKLAQREVKDTDIWCCVSKTLVDQFEGNVSTLLTQAQNNGPVLLKNVREANFMSLSGPKVGSLWLRMLNDSCCPISGLGEIPIPVDRHVCNASFAFGALSGEYDPNDLEFVTAPVQNVWFEAAAIGGFRALDLDVSLWYLGKLGCSKGEPCPKRHECPVIDFCTYWKEGVT